METARIMRFVRSCPEKLRSVVGQHIRVGIVLHEDAQARDIFRACVHASYLRLLLHDAALEPTHTPLAHDAANEEAVAAADADALEVSYEFATSNSHRFEYALARSGWKTEYVILSRDAVRERW